METLEVLEMELWALKRLADMNEYEDAAQRIDALIADKQAQIEAVKALVEAEE